MTYYNVWKTASNRWTDSNSAWNDWLCKPMRLTFQEAKAIADRLNNGTNEYVVKEVLKCLSVE